MGGKYPPKKRRAYQNAWRARNVERARGWERRYARSPKGLRTAAARRRLREYGLSPDAYAALVIESGGFCPICGRQSEPTGQRALVVDHCHKAEEVRGLVCLRCNTLLGYLDEEVLGPAWLRSAEVYLKR
jgi:recombination endonuclease VII